MCDCEAPGEFLDLVPSSCSQMPDDTIKAREAMSVSVRVEGGGEHVTHWIPPIVLTQWKIDLHLRHGAAGRPTNFADGAAVVVVELAIWASRDIVIHRISL